MMRLASFSATTVVAVSAAEQQNGRELFMQNGKYNGLWNRELVGKANNINAPSIKSKFGRELGMENPYNKLWNRELFMGDGYSKMQPHWRELKTKEGALEKQEKKIERELKMKRQLKKSKNEIWNTEDSNDEKPCQHLQIGDFIYRDLDYEGGLYAYECAKDGEGGVYAQTQYCNDGSDHPACCQEEWAVIQKCCGKGQKWNADDQTCEGRQLRMKKRQLASKNEWDDFVTESGEKEDKPCNGLGEGEVIKDDLIVQNNLYYVCEMRGKELIPITYRCKPESTYPQCKAAREAQEGRQLLSNFANGGFNWNFGEQPEEEQETGNGRQLGFMAKTEA